VLGAEAMAADSCRAPLEAVSISKKHMISQGVLCSIDRTLGDSSIVHRCQQSKKVFISADIVWVDFQKAMATVI
jgi:hypothetical protein